MDEFDIRIIIVLLLVVFGSTLAAFARKLKNKIFKPGAPVYTVRFESKNRSPVEQPGIIIPLPDGLVNGAVAAFETLQTLPDIEDDLLNILEERFISGQENKAFAKAAVNTFKAWHGGMMLAVIDPDGQFSSKAKKPFLPKINNPEFEKFVLYTFLGVQNSELMPETSKKLQNQYQRFFESYELKENEFLLGWAQQAMLTNQNLIFFTDEPAPEIEFIIPVPDLKGMSLIQTGLERLK